MEQWEKGLIIGLVVAYLVFKLVVGVYFSKKRD